MKKVNWNKYEVSVLIYGYHLYEVGKYTKQLLINEISSKLRNYAVDDSLKLDLCYRNCNGISMKLGNVQYLFTNGEKGLKNNSLLESELYELFIENREKFDVILNEAKGIYHIFLDE